MVFWTKNIHFFHNFCFHWSLSYNRQEQFTKVYYHHGATLKSSFHFLCKLRVLTNSLLIPSLPASANLGCAERQKAHTHTQLDIKGRRCRTQRRAPLLQLSSPTLVFESSAGRRQLDFVGAAPGALTAAQISGSASRKGICLSVVGPRYFYYTLGCGWWRMIPTHPHSSAAPLTPEHVVQRQFNRYFLFALTLEERWVDYLELVEYLSRLKGECILRVVFEFGILLWFSSLTFKIRWSKGQRKISFSQVEHKYKVHCTISSFLQRIIYPASLILQLLSIY